MYSVRIWAKYLEIFKIVISSINVRRMSFKNTHGRVMSGARDTFYHCEYSGINVIKLSPSAPKLLATRYIALSSFTFTSFSQNHSFCLKVVTPFTI